MKNQLPPLSLKAVLIFLWVLSNPLYVTHLFGQCNPTSDSLALVALYNATNGQGWTNSTNWLVPGKPIGTWYGVELQEEGCVYRINLYNNKLSGFIPAELGNLTKINLLVLSFNQLSGPIPPELGNLQNVYYIELHNNILSGPIPPELGNMANLEYLYLLDNQLSGPIPPELGNLAKMFALRMSGNQLSGSIPPELGNLASLNVLWMSGNQLSGSIPPELGKLVKLYDLQLSSNQLSGCFPSELSSLCNVPIKIFSNNPLLPWQGNFANFCAGQTQVGAQCNDSNPATTGEVIQSDCSCAVLPCSVPSQPSVIQGDSLVCQGTTNTYSVSAVSSTEYIWTLPSGWTGSSTTNSITATAGSSGGFISVKAKNACGESAATSLNINLLTPPSQPGAISGPTTFCPGSSISYSITPVSGATYVWSLPLGWTGSPTANSITVTAGSAGGNISVKTKNACGESAATSLNINVLTTPSQPGTISGPTSLCDGQSDSYSVSAVPGATSYHWTLPSGWSINSYNANSITVTAGSGSGVISVSAVNDCDQSSAVQQKAVNSLAPPSQPGSISGPTPVCQSTTNTYFVPDVAGATSYTWDLPFGWTVSSSGSNSITATANANSGVVSVTVSNSSGCTSKTSTYVSINNAPSVTGTNSTTTCGLDNGFATPSAYDPNGGPLNYSWNNGATTASLQNLAAGSYTVTVTNSVDCMATATSVVNPSIATTATASATAASCGKANGAVTISTSGTTGLPTYKWSNNSTAKNLQNVAALTYSVTVTSSNTCTATASATVTGTTAPTAIASATAAACGLPNGSVSLSVSGSTGATKYLWSNGDTTQILQNILAGTYTVLVTSGNTCTATATATVPGTPGPSATVKIDSAACGQNNNAINLSVSGTTEKLTYLWSNKDTTQNLQNVPAGNYSVTVTSSNGCSTIASTTVVERTIPVIELTPTGATCAVVNGSIDLGLSGMVGTPSYKWSNGTTTKNLQNIKTGTYSVTATNGNNCSSTASAIVSDTPVPTATAAVTTDSCGRSTGVITLSLNNVVGLPTFLWDNGDITQNLYNIRFGDYTVTVTSGNNCKDTISVSVPGIAPITSSLDIVPAACGLSNNNINLTVQGAIGIPSYRWDNGATTQNRQNVPAGNYSVTVTNGNGCSSISSIAVAERTIPVLNLTPTGATCAKSNGRIELSLGGIVGTPSFEWSNGDTTQNLQNIKADTYSVTVTNGNDCSVTSISSVDDTPVPKPITTATAASCGLPNGAVNLSVSDTVETTTYLWSNNTTAKNLQNVNGGTYTVIVTSGNGCTATSSVNIIESKAPPAATVIAPTAVLTCTNTSIYLSAANSSGQGNLSYVWSGGGTGSIKDVTSPGTYAVTVTDAATACTATASTNIAENKVPPKASVDAPTSVLTCTNISILLSAANSTGQGTLSYTWSGGGTGSTEAVTSPGTYIVTVTDAANGCTTFTSTIITKNLNAPSATVSAPTSVLTCTNTSILLSAANSTGQGSLSYTWSGGGTGSTKAVTSPGTYIVTVTDDANGCTAFNSTIITQNLNAPSATVSAPTSVLTCTNTSITLSAANSTGQGTLNYTWSGGGTGTTKAVTSPDTYTVTVTDATNGCTAFSSTVINQNINAPSAKVSSPTSVLTCTNTSITLSAANSTGQGTLSYIWSGGGTGSTKAVTYPGTYIVTVVDAANGCTAFASTIISQNINPPAVSVGLPTSVLTCADTSIYLSAANSTGQGNLSYTWSGGGTGSTKAVTSPGTYIVTVTDAANGCSSIASTNITQNIIVPKVNSIVTATSCGQSNGVINLNLTDVNGTPIYSWSSAQSTQNLQNISSGAYSVTVTSGNGCTATATITVPNSENPSLDMTIGDETCFMEKDGFAIAKVITKAVPPYSYTLNGKSYGQQNDFFDLSPGDYKLEVKDAAGCETLVNFKIQEAADLRPKLGPDRTITIRETVKLDAGINASSYTWFSEDNSTLSCTNCRNPIATPIRPKRHTSASAYPFVYILKVSNNLCEYWDTITINVLPKISVVPFISANKDGINDYFEIPQISDSIKDPDNELVIFNRWGEIVYRKKPYDNTWDGKDLAEKELPEGTYYYIIRLNIVEGIMDWGRVIIIREK